MVPLRIGLVTPAWPGTNTANGIATAVAQIAMGLEACGHEVTIITHAVDGPSDHPRVVTLPPHRMSLAEKLLMRFDPAVAINRTVARRLVVAVHEASRLHGVEVVVMEETQGWAGAVSKRIRIPLVVTLHGPWWVHKALQGPGHEKASARREAREAAGLRLADGITAPSLDTLERTRAAWGLPDVPATVIPNPVLPPAEAVVLDAARIMRILFVGRFDLIKGGDVVINAFALIAQQHASCRLTFAGPDNGVLLPDGRRVTLAETLARLPDELRARIDVCGKQSREEVAAHRLNHGISIVASRYETFGGTLVEAMAAGSAVVCTRVGGCQENITDGETGLLVPPEDPKALADACLRLLHDTDLAQRLGKAARAHVGAVLSPKTVATQLAAFLTPICRR